MQSRNLSFSESERDKLILKVYDKNGKSAFAKHAMYEYIQSHPHLLEGIAAPKTEIPITQQPQQKTGIKNKKSMLK